MELAGGQDYPMDGIEFMDTVESLTLVDGVTNWKINEYFKENKTEYIVNMLEFDYIEDFNTLIARDLNDYIFGNMTNLSCISLDSVKSITVHNDKEFIITFNDGYIVVEGVDNSTL